ncbi:ATP-binding protein [Actinoplanes derwentensis]|uniref:Predicted ATPase n=1 Tax=Actinoplanes derwentensis TaxID=113562 RepID=A0A1H2CWX7_9ACTN|nr:LuxR C-terminal-related transcriptional regulator [Actinoplanes derwentensis]GID87916.1 hypothetical protein Ade03nite_68400 [Actinoplanes derwentensis]SDT75015.1 Predicted ATPase [Actinoplanes derwentensis]
MTGIAGVSARESEVLAGVGAHLTNAEIAARLGISIRTVESHVSSLLRKADAIDRRALAGLAGAGIPPPPLANALPLALTPLIGRAAERAALIAALDEHRQVTAVGPGGIGKTRLALAATAELAGRLADGVTYVDLVPVTDTEMVAAAVAEALGGRGHAGRSAADTVVARLGGRAALLVLDNCEHLTEGVVALVEQLLTRCPRVRVLTVGRARLLTPYERVFPVSGMSDGDAAELFRARAEASGGAGLVTDAQRVTAICRRLDGMPLAIELAAARLPALGLDGLEGGLADRMRLLAGGRPAEHRHRSLASAVDWSHALLSEAQRVVLRRVSVFATPFTAPDAAGLLAGWPPAEPDGIAAALATLTEQSLLTVTPDPTETRYRALETIRQYGGDRLTEAGELAEAHARHLRWCLVLADTFGELPDTASWEARFDRVADELRAALSQAIAGAEPSDAGYRLAVRLAELCFARGLPGEAQRRYEQAAHLATGDQQAAVALRSAAEAAKVAHVGNEAIRLHRAAADAARRAGDRPRAAYDLALIAEMLHRNTGLLSGPTPPDEAERLIAEATTLADDDPVATARVLAARAHAGSPFDPGNTDLIDRALARAREAGDPLSESSALDQLTSVELANHQLGTAADWALHRIELLATRPVRADTGAYEVLDAYIMATDTAIAAGDLTSARRLAERLRDLPLHREERHLANSRLMVVTALAGAWDETLELAGRFRDDWERAGRPRAGNLSRGTYAAATVHGLRGDDASRATWLGMSHSLNSLSPCDVHHDEFFDALLLLHRGHPGEAAALFASPPDDLRSWYNALWRPWYAALWAESAVLAGHPEAVGRLNRARRSTAGNPIARAIVERSAAFADNDRDGMLAVAERMRAAGCRYQWARTLVLAGGPERGRGEEALAGMKATPMSAGRLPEIR